MALGEVATQRDTRQIFRFNPGKSMQLYPERHPYLPKGCGNCDMRLNLAFDAKSEKCKACEEINRQKRIAINRKKYEELKKGPDYKDVEFNPETGALKATHVGHKVHLNDKKTYFDEKLTGDDLEKECQSEIFRMGGSCILRDESKLLANGKEATALDAYINGFLTDIKSVTEPTPLYKNQLNAKNSQLGRWNYQNPNEMASTITLYFHEPSFFSMEKLEESVRGLKKLRK